MSIKRFINLCCVYYTAYKKKNNRTTPCAIATPAAKGQGFSGCPSGRTHFALAFSPRALYKALGAKGTTDVALFLRR